MKMNKLVKLQLNGMDIEYSSNANMPGKYLSIFNTCTDAETVSRINCSILSGQCRNFGIARRVDPDKIVKVIRGPDYINIVTKDGIGLENEKGYWKEIQVSHKERNKWFKSQPIKFQNKYKELAAIITGEETLYKKSRSFWQRLKGLFVSEPEPDPFQEIAKEVCKIKRKVDCGWANSEKISIGDMVKNRGRKSK
jgi:hypothetical protein